MRSWRRVRILDEAPFVAPLGAALHARDDAVAVHRFRQREGGM